MFTSVIDLLYFAKAFKTLVLDLLLNIIKKLFNFIKYLFTLKWMFDLIGKTNSIYSNIIYSSKYFKSFAFIFKTSLILGIVACLILKYLKTNKLTSLNDKDDEQINTEINKEENKEDEEVKFNIKDQFTNIIQSEERWKPK